jgi:spermidine synthase
MRRAFVFALFFLSGAASLADEVVWFKYLNLTFGATTSATATLLAVFMGGLALGSWLFGKLSPRISRPLLVYGLLEGGVGLFALATPLLFAAVEAGYVFAYRHGAQAPGPLLLARILLAAGALLPPTILMGGTFPVLARHAETSDLPGRASGWLYGVNTAGAVTGVVVCGFIAIPQVGLHATLAVSACVSLGAALTAALWRQRTEPSPLETELPPERLWLLIAAVTGAAAMADEVLWTRILVLHLGSSVYAFSLMLSVYLTGIVAGSLFGASRPAADYGRSLFSAQMALCGVLIAQVFAFMIYSKGLVFVGVDLLHAHNYFGLLATQAIVTTLCLFPPTFLMGMTFALLLKAAHRSATEAGRSAGALYAANTVGGIIGSLLGAFLVLPSVGSQNALLLAALASLGVAFALRPKSVAVWIGAGVFAVLSAAAPRDRVILSAGVFSSVPRRDLLFYDEDVTATVAVKRFERPNPWLSLEVNGVNVAGTSSDLVAIQKLQAHLPLSLARRPQRVLHVGFGSGGTAYSVSLHPVSEIQVVEISLEVIRASARFFQGVNHGVLKDPRVHVTLNDGRNFILASPASFDVVLSDSIHPRYAGNGSLYTEDYFRLCARRLSPGGVISMWLPMYSLLPENYRSIVKAFNNVFPNVSIWYAHSVANAFTIVLATPESTINLKEFAEGIAAPEVQQDLGRIGAADPAELLSYLLLGPEDVRAWDADAPAHTDDRPLVEYESGRTLLNVNTWLATFADLAARRGHIENFVTGLAANDPLSVRVRKRFAESQVILRRHLEALRALAAKEP